MRAIKGRAEGNVIRLLEPMPEIVEQEVIVLIPTQADETFWDILTFAGIWADMSEQEWRRFQESLEQGTQMGD